MLVSDIFDSKYIKSADLNGRQVKVKIAATEVIQLGDPPQTKINIYFEGKQKSLVCNRTNAMILADTLGPDTNNWIGAEIVISARRTMYKGQPTMGLHVDVPPSAAPRQVPSGIKSNGNVRIPSGPSSDDDDPRTTRTPLKGDGLDDEVPF